MQTRLLNQTMQKAATHRHKIKKEATLLQLPVQHQLTRIPVHALL